MWNVVSPNLALLTLVASGSVAAAQTPQAAQQAQLRAAVIAPPAAPAADRAGRPALYTSPGAARLDSTHLAAPPPQDPGSLAASGKSPLRLKPARRDDVDVDFTFDSADPLDGRFAADRPGLMGLKGRVRF